MSSPALNMLERTILPNGSFRQSPYLDALQATLLSSDDAAFAKLLSGHRHAIGKTQFELLDLSGRDQLARRIDFLDASGTCGLSTVAFLDFLLLWESISALYQVSFPFELSSITVLERADGSRTQTQHMLAAYSSILRERHPGDTGFAGEIREWLENAQLLSKQQRSTNRFDLIVADAHVGLDTKHLATGGTMIVRTAGTQRRSSALSAWRRSTVADSQDLRPVGPCGEEFGRSLPACCDTCWPVRSERLDLPDIASESDPALPAARAPLGTETMSWAYTMIGRAASSAPPDDSPEPAGLRYVGAFRGTHPVPVEPNGTGADSAGVFLKICPATNNNEPTVVETTQTKLAPDLRYGDRLDLTVQDFNRSDRGVILHPASQEIAPVRPLEVERTGAFIPLRAPDLDDSNLSGLDEVGYRLFGFAELREFQHAILGRVLAGQSILGIAATGGGKSECFILPAMLMPGITVVISPLKSLMMDQYEERIVRRFGLAEQATWINGDLSKSEQRHRLDRTIRGHYKLIYLTPEQLDKETTVEALQMADQRIGIRYLAIDEAHCISHWGHDFRPSYLSTLRRLADAGIDPVRIALTATASPQVREDICQELGLTNAPLHEGGDVYIYSSNRPELNLITRVVPTRPNKVSQIVDELRPFARPDGDDGSAIVFMPWTEAKKNDPSDETKVTPHVTSMAAYLENALRTRVSVYHSKMEQDESRQARLTGVDEEKQSPPVEQRDRGSEQQAFIRGDHRIMVATKGFGMGIDKPDIRMVIHATPPGNLEAYVQEAGRAGRDGQPANVVLYYSPDGVNRDDFFSDYRIQQNFLEQKRMDRVDVLGIVRFLMLRYREHGATFQINAEDLIEYVEQYRLSQNEPEKEFPERRMNQTESPQHMQILDRGHRYQEWSAYLDRMIRELDSFSTLAAQADRAPLFQQVDFPNRLRDPEYQAMPLEEKREVFGARWRAFPNVAMRRATEDGREKPTRLDDWFSDRELPWPRGWTITAGKLFDDQQEFVNYVYAFCEAHEQRYLNARDSYTRLLTDYLGLKPDGTINPSAEPECLRSVMLGYLKTNEIVQDGNCRSCSNCVPDERFDRYSLQERRDAVIRIDEEIQDLLERLEASMDQLPDEDELQPLLDAVNRDTDSAHALHRYVAGWSGRILDEQPEHVGVRWLRLSLFEDEESIEPRQDEFVNHLRSLVQHVQAVQLPRVRALLDRVREIARFASSREIVGVQAEIAHRMGLHAEEAGALAQLRDLIGDATASSAEDTRWLYDRMSTLHGPDGPLPDGARFQEAELQLARISSTPDEASGHYRQAGQSWTEDTLYDELRILDLFRTTRVESIWGLLRTWMSQSSPDQGRRVQVVMEYLDKANAEVIDRADTSDLHQLLRLADADRFAMMPVALERLAARLLASQESANHLHPDAVVLIGKLMDHDQPLPERVARPIVARVVASDNPGEIARQLAQVADGNAQLRANLAMSLSRVLEDLDVPGLRNWLRAFDVDLHLQIPEIARNLIAALIEPIADPELRAEVIQIAAVALWEGSRDQSLHRHWIGLHRRDGGTLGEYIQDCLEADPPEIELAELAFSRMLETRRLRDLGPFLQWAIRNEQVANAPRIGDAAMLFQSLVRWASERSSDRQALSGAAPEVRQHDFEAWAEANDLERLQAMNPDDYRTLVDVYLRRMQT